MSRDKSCEERIDEKLANRLEDLRKLLALHYKDPEAYTDELGRLEEYGLCVDYVEPGTFGDEQTEGYLRYQLSWGGPSSEFRYYVDWGGTAYKIEYWFLDWFDGAHRELSGEDESLLLDIWEALYFEGVLPQK